MTTLDRHRILADLNDDDLAALHDAVTAEEAAWEALDAPAYLRVGDRTLLDRLDQAHAHRLHCQHRLARNRRHVAAQGDA